MKKTTLAIAASLSLNCWTSAQDTRSMTTNNEILREIVRANRLERQQAPQKTINSAYSCAVNALRRCENYAADRETIGSLKVKMDMFYEAQGFEKGYINSVAISRLNCDLTDIDLPSTYRDLGIGVGNLNRGAGYMNECTIAPARQRRFKVFSTSGRITAAPLGFEPKHGQEFAPVCCASLDGITILDVIESIPARFAHESGHYYYSCSTMKEQ